MNAVKRLLWWLLAGSAGGINRGRMLKELLHTPHNANELATVLHLDYKTVRHHLEILKKNNLITSTGSGYGTVYFPSDLLEEHVDIFHDIWARIGKNEIKKDNTR
jgi:DNA-binding transcriptional ArsR family regulator